MYLGRVCSIRVCLNAGFLLLAVFYAAVGFFVPLILTVAALFLHEMAHALTARAFRVKVERVELLPFGGQAVIEDIMALSPEKEIMVALSGPAASLMLAAVAYFFRNVPPLDIFMMANLFLGLFNLIPGLPLDGGRLMRSAFSNLVGFKSATRIFALLGQVWGGLLFVGGMLGLILHYPEAVNPLVIGMVLFFAARRENGLFYYSFVRYLIRKRGILDRKGLVSARTVVARETTMVKSLLTLTGPSDYLVVMVEGSEGEMKKILLEEFLVEEYINRGPQLKIGDFLEGKGKN